MLFAEQVGKGNRPNTHLNALGYVEVEKGFKERTRIVATKVQIKNKWDKLKEDFKAWKKLMLRQTRTGCDPIKKTIAMDDEWWKKARAVSWFKIFAIFVLHMTDLLVILIIIPVVLLISGHSGLWKVQKEGP